MFKWHFIPSEMIYSIFNSVSGQSLMTAYMKYHEMKFVVSVISLRSFWIKWNLISSDKMFWKHYPKMKPFEKKHLHLRIFNWNKYSRSKDQNKNSWKIMYMKTNVNRILFMAKRNFISVKYGFVSNLNTFLQWTYPS